MEEYRIKIKNIKLLLRSDGSCTIVHVILKEYTFGIIFDPYIFTKNIEYQALNIIEECKWKNIK